MVCSTPASRKAKGHEFQNLVMSKIIDLGIDPLDIQSTPGGQQGCDLYLSKAARDKFKFGIECKRSECFNLTEAWNQCKTNAEKEQLTPLLVHKKNRSDTLVTLKLDDFLCMAKKVMP